MAHLSSTPVFEARPCDDAHRVTLWSDVAETAERWCAALAAEGVDTVVVDEPDAAADAHLLLTQASVVTQLARLRRQREALPQAPLLLIARGLRDLDHVLALESGADDVIDASVSAAVVAARLRALWRRGALGAAGSAAVPTPPVLRFGALQLFLHERRVQLGGTPVALSDAEFEVLWLLASEAGRVVPRGDLLRRVRGLDPDPLDRSIDTRVYRIRAKLSPWPRPGPGIRTVRNIGYAFSPRDW